MSGIGNVWTYCPKCSWPMVVGEETCPNCPATIDGVAWVRVPSKGGDPMSVKRYNVGCGTEHEDPNGYFVEAHDYAALLADRDKIMRALESLTPSGSEFHNDPERCAAFVRESNRSATRSLIRFKNERDVAEEKHAALLEAARLLAKECAAWRAEYKKWSDGNHHFIEPWESIADDSNTIVKSLIEGREP